jgi:hypothetical protein
MKNSNLTKTKKRARILILVGTILIAITPFLLTHDSFLESLDFTETGPIGDTIGGITAPFVNLLGAILVYFALIAQIDANELVRKQFDLDKEHQSINSQFQYLEQNVKDFRFTGFIDDISGPEEKEHIGSRAFHEMFSQMRCFHGTDEELLNDPAVAEVYSILEIMSLLLQQLKQDENPNKIIIRRLTEHLFLYKIITGIRDQEEKDLISTHCESCGYAHGMPPELLNRITEIRNLLKE